MILFELWWFGGREEIVLKGKGVLLFCKVEIVGGVRVEVGRAGDRLRGGVGLACLGGFYRFVIDVLKGGTW